MITKILFFLCVCFICFMNFESIVESLFYGPEKTYQIGLLYDSRKSTAPKNISLYEAFSIEFLHKSEDKLKFPDLINLDRYKLHINSVFSALTPVSHLYLLPWRLNASNLEAVLISVNYSLVGDTYSTNIAIFQFDDYQDIGFTPYESATLPGKLLRVFDGNQSVHLQLATRDQNQLVSIMPANLLQEKAIIQKHSFNKSYDFLLWDQSPEALVYILEQTSFLVHTQLSNGSVPRPINIAGFALEPNHILSNPLQLNLVVHANQTYLFLTFLPLCKNTISLKYTQYLLKRGQWQLHKQGVLSLDIGVNPKEYNALWFSKKTVVHYSWQQGVYMIALARLYVLPVETTEHSCAVYPLKDNHYLDKIVAYDQQKRLLLKYRDKQSPETTLLELVLLDPSKTYEEMLKQEIQKFEDCYDISLQTQDQAIMLFVVSELEYLDVYTLLEYDNPSILKGSFRKILAIFALYKFSRLKLFERYFQIF